MPQSASRSELKFLLDENIKARVGRFLKSEGFDVVFAPKSFPDTKLAGISKSEGRVIVTNDSDFRKPFEFPKERVFSIILVAIPQDKPEAFIPAFSRLLKEKTKPEDFERLLIILKEEYFEVSRILSLKTLKSKGFRIDIAG